VQRLKTRFDYDVAVIGGGSAGYAAGRTAASNGLKTVLFEGGPEVGGLCILRGCMPSKALLHAAEIMHVVRSAPTWGIHPKSVKVDFNKVMSRKRRLIKEFADYREVQLRDGRFKFVRALARFTDDHTVELDSGKKVTAAHFIIATGSTIAPSPIPSLSLVDCITSDEALSLKRLPKSLIVLGGGAVATELAQFFVRFGVRVTMIQRSETILTCFDEDAAQPVETVFRREGIRLYTKTQLLEGGRAGTGKFVRFRHKGKIVRVEAEEILFALGRIPNTSGLALDRAGVKTQGALIHTNSRMQTNVPHIFAAGDCTGLHEIVHIAVQQGETAAYNAAFPRNPRRMDYRLFTSVVFTHPQVASVGLTEKEARQRKIPVIAASYPFNDHGKSMIMEENDGFVKLLANPKTGEILGGTCVGPVAGELIHEISAAMFKRMTVRELAAMPHYHPTLAEIWTYPAEELAEKISA
jgi:pyruvate/2-oxoglutarate dehydrogenase complex dihydrolipoamide dehydrogenase (E3) component